MTDNTPRLDLPFIRASQAQKEVTHNEALARLDGLVQPVAHGVATAPPATPDDGEVWIVAPAATGDWEGHDHALARFADGVWDFLVPAAGFRFRLLDQGLGAEFDGSDWIIGEVRAALVRVDGDAVLGQRQPAITDPAGGGTVDSEARAALIALLDAARAHGLIEE